MEQVLRFMDSRNPIPQVVVLVVIDSLDSRFYADYAADLAGIHELVARDGLLFGCETVTNTTTPAIASILTGLRPESHGILTGEEVGKSKLNSILELLDDAGKPTAAILETKGTKPLLGRIRYVFPVDDREDIVEYDELITMHTITVLKEQDVRFVFAHLRAIDRFAHRGNDLRIAAQITNENMRVIAQAVGERNGVLFICGDHEAHLKEREASNERGKVPLIVGCP